MIVYVLETFETDRAIPYANCIYRLIKLSDKYFRDITDRGPEKCKKNCNAFKGTDSNNKMLYHVLQFKGEPKKVDKRIVKYILCILAHNGSGFDSYVVLKNLLQGRTVVSVIKNGSGLLSFKNFICYRHRKEKIHQNVHFRGGGVHTFDSLKKIGISYELQPSLLTQEMNHDDIYEDPWENKETEWLTYLKNSGSSTAFWYARYSMGTEQITGFGIKNSLTLPSLTKNYFDR